MNLSRVLLVLTAGVWLAMVGTAAPVPDIPPPSQGPVSDILRQRDKLPMTASPRAMSIRGDKDLLEVERTAYQYVTEVREGARQVEGGRVEKYQYTVTVPVAVTYKQQVNTKECKFFTVTKAGKLEALDAAKALPMLKKPAAVLAGESAELDARQLAMVRPGTMFVVIPQESAVPVPVPGPGVPVPIPPEERIPREDKP